MKILLLEAPYSYGNASGIVGRYFPLGIGYIASFLDSLGHEVRVLEIDSVSELFEDYNHIADDYEVIGISVMTCSYPMSIKIADWFKLQNPSIAVVLGGHHVSAVKEAVFSDSEAIDFVIFGEGEHAFSELLQNLEGGGDFASIKGLIWKDSGNVVSNPGRELITELDSLPFPCKKIEDIGRYRLHSYIDFGKKSATMITSRGCPFKCLYCSSHLTMGTKYRVRSVENIVDEVKYLVEVHRVDHIVFEDDAFTLKRDRVLALCEEFKKIKNMPTWYCLSKVESMDYELAVAMRKANCRMIAFGVESGNQEILKKVGKTFKLDQGIRVLNECRRAGLNTLCTFIVGFPFDTDKTMRETYEFALKLNPTIAIFFPLTPYPGTPIYDHYLKEQFKPHSALEWADYVITNMSAPISTNEKYSSEQIKSAADKWNKKFYFRPIQVWRLLQTVSKPSDLLSLIKAMFYLIRV